MANRNKSPRALKAQEADTVHGALFLCRRCLSPSTGWESEYDGDTRDSSELPIGVASAELTTGAPWTIWGPVPPLWHYPNQIIASCRRRLFRMGNQKN